MSDKEPPSISRRAFLKVIGAAAAVYVAKRLGVTISSANNGEAVDEKGMFTSENVSGVDVYGLKERISSVEDVTQLSNQIDDEFIRSNKSNTTISSAEDLLQLQKELLNPNERYLEVVIRRSAYDSFEQRREETGVNFPEWIKVHVDILNKCLDEAQPSVKMKTILRRIVVVEDECVENMWNEDAYRSGSGHALDQRWHSQFWPPVDTDASWAISDDYRMGNGAYFYDAKNDNGKVVIEKYLAGGNIKKRYELPGEIGSIKGTNEVKFDMGMIHEWSHRLLNLPDEYLQDVSESKQRFNDFVFSTGSLLEPVISPYLSCVLQENIELKARNIKDPKLNRGNEVFSEHPENIRIAACFNDINFGETSIGVTAVRLVENSYYGRKEVPPNSDQESKSGPIDLSSDFFNIKTNCWLVRVGNKNGMTSEVFFPAAAFNMSKIAGLKSAEYNIVFSGYDDTSKTKQEVKLINKDDMVRLHNNQQDPIYAEMEISGTDTYLVWFLRS